MIFDFLSHTHMHTRVFTYRVILYYNMCNAYVIVWRFFCCGCCCWPRLFSLHLEIEKPATQPASQHHHRQVSSGLFGCIVSWNWNWNQNHVNELRWTKTKMPMQITIDMAKDAFVLRTCLYWAPMATINISLHTCTVRRLIFIVCWTISHS